MKYKKYFTSIITSYTLKKNIKKKKKQSINKNNSNYSWSVKYKAR